MFAIFLNYIFLFCIILQSSSVNNRCIHRNEFRFGQNPSIQRGILKSVLKNYEKVHYMATVDGGMERDLLKVINASDDFGTRYIYVHMDSGGISNRLINLISGFAVALLTKRVLIIKSNNIEFDQLLCSPFPLSSWSFPSSFKWDSVTGAEERGDKKITVIDNRTPSSTEAVLAQPPEELNKYQILVIVNGQQYFLPTLFAIPHYAEKMNLWFPDRNVAHVLANYLLHPSNVVWENILQTWESVPRYATVIGMQVRFIGPESTMHCIHTEQYYTANTTIFVASLMNVTEEIQAAYPNATARVIQKYIETTENHATDQFQHALHDLWILSMTDVTILSPHSTLGNLAMALKGRPCLYPVHGRYPDLSLLAETDDILNSTSSINAVDKVIVRNQCNYAISQEICFHFRVYGEYGHSNEYMNRTFMRCEDYEGRNNPQTEIKLVTP